MKVTKFGHCCLLIEEKGLRILTDPGCYSTGQSEVKNINLILITHEHADHLHIPSLKECLKNNPQAKVVTNNGTAKLLDKENIKYEILEQGQSKIFNDVLIEGFGKKHAEMYKTLIAVDNTGYFISKKLFYPGDSFYNPGMKVEILALPVAGPWMKLSEAIDYALKLKPKICFPVHEGILKTPGSVHRIPKEVLEKEGISFIILEENNSTDLN